MLRFVEVSSFVNNVSPVLKRFLFYVNGKFTFNIL